jgi:hypothetical protein
MKKPELTAELALYMIPESLYKSNAEKIAALEQLKKIIKKQEKGETVAVSEEWAVSSAELRLAYLFLVLRSLESKQIAKAPKKLSKKEKPTQTQKSCET